MKMPFWRKYTRKSKVHELKQEFNYDLSSYEETLTICMSVFKTIGIRLTKQDSNFSRFWWNVFFWFEFLNLFTTASLELINLIVTAAGGSLIDMFKMLPCVGYLVLAMAKSYKIVYYRPVFENLMSELSGMWPQRGVTQEEHLILSTAIKQLEYISKGYYWSNFTLNIVFTAAPYIQIIKRLAGKDVPLILSFFFWTPFDPFQRGYYEVLLVVQTWECFLSVWFMLAGDLMFFVALSHITTQFDLLAVRISKFFPVTIDNQLVDTYPLAQYANIEPNGDMMDVDALESTRRAEMAEIIKRHQKLIKLSRDVEKMFSFSLLLNFINSSIIICFCGFCCVFLEKWNEMGYKIFLVTATAQIWLLCWYGQRLIDSSNGVTEALYNSGWYISSRKMKTIILIMILRSQSELHITTYGFSVVSLSSFSNIIKTSWSYFTLLINMYD